MHFGFLLPFPADAKMAAPTSPRSLPKLFGALVCYAPPCCPNCVMTRTLSVRRVVDRYFKNTKNLFIHIALIPEGDNPRVNPNILKCLLHSPVAKGYRLVVIASRAIVCKTPTYYLILNSLAFARGCVILRSHILFPLLLILLISHHI